MLNHTVRHLCHSRKKWEIKFMMFDEIQQGDLLSFVESYTHEKW